MSVIYPPALREWPRASTTVPSLSARVRVCAEWLACGAGSGMGGTSPGLAEHQQQQRSGCAHLFNV